jgi:uncharacterized protein YegL
LAEFNADQFTVAKAKPLPVILLLDTSASMNIVVNPDEVVRTGRTGIVEGQLVEYVSGGKTRIDVLNEAVRRMLATLTKEASQANEFLVSVVTFGGTATLKQAPVTSSAIQYFDLSADGDTPLGAAIEVAKSLIEDREQIPSRAYRPLVVLVSDGEPTDSWESNLASFIQDGRSAKCDRMALGIGEEATSGRGRATLERFIAGTEHKVFEAKDAGEVHNFFKFVTMSVVSRSLSQNPNLVPPDSTLRPPTPATAASKSAPAAPAVPEPSKSAPAAPAAPAPSPSAPTTDPEKEDGYW